MPSDKVAVFDTTLRDGEQAAGTRLGSKEKLTIARQLALLKVDIIEAGYPASSPDDFEASDKSRRRSTARPSAASLAPFPTTSPLAAKPSPKPSARAFTPASAHPTSM